MKNSAMPFKITCELLMHLIGTRQQELCGFLKTMSHARNRSVFQQHTQTGGGIDEPGIISPDTLF